MLIYYSFGLHTFIWLFSSSISESAPSGMMKNNRSAVTTTRIGSMQMITLQESADTIRCDAM